MQLRHTFLRSGFNFGRADCAPRGFSFFSTCNVVVLGGCGNFGKLIIENLAHDVEFQVTAVDKRVSSVPSSIRCVSLNVESRHLHSLDNLQPHVIVNAIGDWNDDRILEYCAKKGWHYIDLAPDSSAVARLTKLDASRATGAVLVLGASPTHALPSLVLSKYIREFEDNAALHEVSVSLSPSASILAGQQSWREWLESKADFSMRSGIYRGLISRRLHFRVDSGATLQSHQKKYPSLKRFSSQVGVGSRVLMVLVLLLSKIARLGDASGLLAPVAAQCLKLWPRYGNQDGAMSVSMKGLSRDKKTMELEWQLLDFDGGARVAVAPVLAILKKLRRRTENAVSIGGVFSCDELITLDDVMEVLNYDTIHAGTYSNATNSPWRHVFSNELFAQTPPKIMDFHVGDPKSDGSTRHVVAGDLTVSSDDTPLIRFLTFLTKLPKNRAVCPVTVQVEGLRWRRSFNTHQLNSVFSLRGGVLVESFLFGLIKFAFQILPAYADTYENDEGIELRKKNHEIIGFSHRFIRMWILGIPIPEFFAVNPTGATIFTDDDAWFVEVNGTSSFLGKVIKYVGTVKIVE